MDKFEKFIKKSIKNSPDYEPERELRYKVKQELGIVSSEKAPFLKRNLLRYATCLICFMLLLSVCIMKFSSNDSTKQYFAIVQVEVNPKIELIVNEKGVVTSVKGINDEGKMIVLDEKFSDSNLFDTLGKIIELETNTGFINPNLREENLNIKVTAEDSTIINDIRNKISSFVNSSSVNLKLHLINGKNVEELKDYVLNLDPTLTMNDLNKLNYNELISKVADFHNEVKDIYSEDLEKIYLEIKKQCVSKTIENDYYTRLNNLDDEYDSFKIQYNNFYELLAFAYSKLNDNYINLFVKDDSLYKTTLKSLNEKKEEILYQRKLINEKKSSNEFTTFEEIILKTFEEQYRILEKALLEIKEKIEDIHDTIINEINEIIVKLNEIKESLKDIIVEMSISDIFDEINELLDYKKNINDTFINDYKDEINNKYEELKARKTHLMRAN